MHQIRSPGWWDEAHIPFSKNPPLCSWPFEPRTQTQHTHILVRGAATDRNRDTAKHSKAETWKQVQYKEIRVWHLAQNIQRTSAILFQASKPLRQHQQTVSNHYLPCAAD